MSTKRQQFTISNDVLSMASRGFSMGDLNFTLCRLNSPNELIDRTTNISTQILAIPGLCVLLRRVILRRLQIELILCLGLIGIKPPLNGFRSALRHIRKQIIRRIIYGHRHTNTTRKSKDQQQNSPTTHTTPLISWMDSPATVRQCVSTQQPDRHLERSIKRPNIGTVNASSPYRGL